MNKNYIYLSKELGETKVIFRLIDLLNKTVLIRKLSSFLAK